MRPSDTLEKYRDSIRLAALRHRTMNPRVFGSVLHGRDTEDSDLDIVVDTMAATSLFDLGELQEELQTLLGVRVEVLTPKDIPLSFREAVLREALPI